MNSIFYDGFKPLSCPQNHNHSCLCHSKFFHYVLYLPCSTIILMAQNMEPQVPRNLVQVLLYTNCIFYCGILESSLLARTVSKIKTGWSQVYSLSWEIQWWELSSRNKRESQFLFSAGGSDVVGNDPSHTIRERCS